LGAAQRSEYARAAKADIRSLAEVGRHREADRGLPAAAAEAGDDASAEAGDASDGGGGGAC